MLQPSRSRSWGRPAGGQSAKRRQELQLRPKPRTERLALPIFLICHPSQWHPPCYPHPELRGSEASDYKHNLYTQMDQGSWSGFDPYNYLCDPEQANSAFLSLCFLIWNTAIPSWCGCWENENVLRTLLAVSECQLFLLLMSTHTHTSRNSWISSWFISYFASPSFNPSSSPRTIAFCFGVLQC